MPVQCTCITCGAVFSRYVEGLYCSPACYHAGRRVAPLDTRFWVKVTKTDGCWVWTGSTQGGYGQMSAGRRGQPPLRAHRVSWEIHYGAIPDGLFVLHTCDTPPCVNPSHLFLGDAEANARDMVAKGRHGSRSHPEKFPGGNR